MTKVAQERGMTLQEHLQDVIDTLLVEHRAKLQHAVTPPEKPRSGIDEFREVLQNTRVPSNPQDRQFTESELGLLSRSAYMDFFTDVTIKKRWIPSPSVNWISCFSAQSA